MSLAMYQCYCGKSPDRTHVRAIGSMMLMRMVRVCMWMAVAMTATMLTMIDLTNFSLGHR